MCKVLMIKKLEFSDHVEIVMDGAFPSPLLEFDVLLDGILLHNRLDRIEPITGEDGKVRRFACPFQALPFGIDKPKNRDPETGLRPTTQGLPWNSVKARYAKELQP